MFIMRMDIVNQCYLQALVLFLQVVAESLSYPSLDLL